MATRLTNDGVRYVLKVWGSVLLRVTTILHVDGELASGTTFSTPGTRSEATMGNHFTFTGNREIQAAVVLARLAKGKLVAFVNLTKDAQRTALLHMRIAPPALRSWGSSAVPSGLWASLVRLASATGFPFANSPIPGEGEVVQLVSDRVPGVENVLRLLSDASLRYTHMEDWWQRATRKRTLPQPSVYIGHRHHTTGVEPHSLAVPEVDFGVAPLAGCKRSSTEKPR